MNHSIPSCMALLALVATGSLVAAGKPGCHVCSYRLADGKLVDVSADDGDTLQWQEFDGVAGELHKGADGAWKSSYGWTNREDGKTVRFPDCAAGRINFAGVSGERIAFDVKETTFQSRGTKLVGRLVMPKGTAKV